MRRRRRLASLFLSLAAFAPSFAGPADAAAVSRTGVFRVSVIVFSAGSLPPGASLNLNVTARAIGPTGAQSASGAETTQKTADTQTVTIDVPYRWFLQAPVNSVSITVTATATTGTTTYGAVTLGTPLPANNATTPVSASVRL